MLPECPVPCLCSNRFVVENLNGTREQDTTPFQDIFRQGTETVWSWAVGRSKKESSRCRTGELWGDLCHFHSRCWCKTSPVEMSYKESCSFLEMLVLAISLQNLWLETFLLDHRTCHFSTSSFNLNYISLQIAWEWLFDFGATSTALFQGKMKTNAFKCFCKTEAVSERPFSSQHLLSVGEEASNWGSTLCFA